MKEDALLIGADLGTHGARVIVVDADGRLVARGTAPYSRIYPRPGWVEQPVEPVWSALELALSDALAAAPAGRVAALSITHQRGTVLGVDRAGQPVGHAICDSDVRSIPQAQWISRVVGQQAVYRRTGCPVASFNGLTKILWLQQAQPALYARVFRWMTLQDFAVHRLTGEWASNPGAALRMGVLDVALGDAYAESLLAQLDVDVTRLLPLVPMGSVVGRVSTQAARATGLPVGLPVIASPGDQPAGLVGVGALSSGVAAVNLGTSFLASLFTPTLTYDLKGRCTVEVLPEGKYALEFGSGAGMNSLDWLGDRFIPSASPKTLLDLAAGVPPGANGLLVIPMWWTAHGDLDGGTIHGLHPHHTIADIVRAALDGLACEVALSIAHLEAASGHEVRVIGLFGGGSRDRLLRRILADVTGRQVYAVQTAEASALGAALIGGLGVGSFPSLATACQRAAHAVQVIDPDPERRDLYQTLLDRYGRLRACLSAARL